MGLLRYLPRLRRAAAANRNDHLQRYLDATFRYCSVVLIALIISAIMRDEPVLRGEYSNWKDTGCELHILCLECPFPYCLEEKQYGKQQVRLNLRASEMRNMMLHGNGIQAVADTFGVSIRTVQRHMKRMLQAGDDEDMPIAM